MYSHHSFPLTTQAFSSFITCVYREDYEIARMARHKHVLGESSQEASSPPKGAELDRQAKDTSFDCQEPKHRPSHGRPPPRDPGDVGYDSGQVMPDFRSITKDSYEFKIPGQGDHSGHQATAAHGTHMRCYPAHAADDIIRLPLTHSSGSEKPRETSGFQLSNR
jgi:hypothetical protein